MDTGIFENSPLQPEDPVVQAIGEMDQAHYAYFQATAVWVRKPLPKHFPAVLESGEAAGQAFCDVITTILNSELLDTNEKAIQIATVTSGANDMRLQLYRRIVPRAQFADNKDQDELSASIKDDFDAGVEPKQILITTISDYARVFNDHHETLLNTISSSKRGKALEFYNKLGSHAAGMGKMTAAVTIGTLISHEIIKKFDR